ncbi:Hypothetical protein ORPV_434 [Orpheovirus IHUMI-LCC2]|uniref:Uncharacterized protein n=1 Tax=Orpheovirus IHUMI-LCC2 TaxID=2023057 RepID=A0A2I2L484_9VIRU|nr:Hypothetical protein ORPV_434 [Orpheovirus IHUMI-LCC2]SNW62338.1 Hypothetical protein ORPV_434 [Orpheovirus IHUMI-LCC2]
MEHMNKKIIISYPERKSFFDKYNDIFYSNISISNISTSKHTYINNILISNIQYIISHIEFKGMKSPIIIEDGEFDRMENMVKYYYGIDIKIKNIMEAYEFYVTADKYLDNHLMEKFKEIINKYIDYYLSIEGSNHILKTVEDYLLDDISLINLSYKDYNVLGIINAISNKFINSYDDKKINYDISCNLFNDISKIVLIKYFNFLPISSSDILKERIPEDIYSKYLIFLYKDRNVIYYMNSSGEHKICKNRHDVIYGEGLFSIPREKVITYYHLFEFIIKLKMVARKGQDIKVDVQYLE